MKKIINRVALKEFNKTELKSIYKVLLLGLIIRLVLIPLAYNPDLISVYWRSHLMLFHGELAGGNELGAHILHMINLWFANLVYPMDDLFVHPEEIVNYKEYTYATISFLKNSNINIYALLYIFKLPYLIVDFLCALLAMRLVDRNKDAVKAISFWILNPILIFGTYIIARYEVFALIFVLLTLLSLKEKKYFKAVMLLGIGVTMRLYLLILILPLLLIVSTNWIKRAKHLFCGMIPSILMVFFGKLAYNKVDVPLVTLTKMNHSRYLLQLQSSLFNEYHLIYWLIVLYGLMCIWLMWMRIEADTFNISTIFSHVSLIILAGLLAGSFFHPQYFLWFVPFSLVIYISDIERWQEFGVLLTIMYILYSLIWLPDFIYLMFGHTLGVSSQFNPHLYINMIISPQLVSSVLRSGITCMLIWIIYQSIKSLKEEMEAYND